MTIAIDIAFLLVYVLGAFAYGSALTLSLRQNAPVWSGAAWRAGSNTRLEPSGVALFAWSAIWFVVLGLDQFIDMATGSNRRSWLDLLQLMLVFGFPPLIMHTTQREGHVAEWPERSRAWARRALAAGYVVAGLGAVLAVGVVVRLWRVPNGDLAIGLTIAGLFTLAGVYSSVVLHNNPRRAQTPEGDNLRRVLNGMFVALALMNFIPTFTSTSALSFSTLGRIMSVTPLLFLSATTYYENRFEFYDLLVKRGAMLLATLLALGAYPPAGAPRWTGAGCR